MRLTRYRDEYLEAISLLAQHVVDNAEVNRLPPLSISERTEFASAPSAFHPESEAERPPSPPKPDDVHFIVAAPNRDEARRVRQDVSFYGERSVDWIPYASTHTVPLAGYAREIAARRGLTAGASSISLNSAGAGDSEGGARIIVLLVDAWASQMDVYRQALERHEERRTAAAALVPRNTEDSETEERWRLLSDGLRSVFLDRIATRDSLAYRQDILSHRAFDEDLQIVLETARNRVFAARGGVPSPPAGSGMARPILEGP
jgi:FxsC-like protein